MTVAGHHTVAELNEWLEALDFQVEQVAQAYRVFAGTWKAKDAAGHDDWKVDWDRFRTRYGGARATARSAISRAALTPVANSLIPVEDEWTTVQRALRANENAPTKGDWAELFRRITGAGAHIDLSRVPQPTSTDADLVGLRAANAAAQVIKDVEGEIRSHLPKSSTATAVLVGGGLVLGFMAAIRFAR